MKTKTGDILLVYMAMEADYGPEPLEIKKAANDNVEFSAKELAEREQQVRVELENFSIKQENERIKNELETQLAGQIALEETSIPEPAAAAGGTPRPPVDPSIIPPQTPRDPSIIPPQTRGPVDDPAILEMSGEGSNWAEAGRFAKKIGGAAYEKSAEWYPYSAFGRLQARMGRFADVVLTAPKRELLWSMHNMNSELAAQANEKVEKYKSEVAAQEKILAEKDAEISQSAKTIQSGGIKGLFTPNVAAKLDRERRAVVDKIEKIKTKQNGAHVILDKYKHREEKWANKQSALAETIVNGIEKNMTPARAEFVHLTARKEEVAARLADLKRARDMGHQGLVDIDAKLKNNPGLIDKVALHETRDAVEAKLKEWEGLQKELAGKQSAIETKMGKVNHKIGEAVAAQTEQLNDTSKNRLRYDQGDQQRGTLERTEHDFDHAPEPKAPEANAEKEPAIELETQEYVALWNVLYGKELKIDANVFATGMKIKPNDARDVKTFEDYIKSKMAPNGKPYSTTQWEIHFKKIRDMVKTGRTN